MTNFTTVNRKAARTLARNDTTLARIIKTVGPCTLRPRRRYFPALCDAIISQQLSVRSADTIIRRFRDLFERTNPTPTVLAALSDERLRSAGISPQKLRYLRDLSEKFSNGHFARKPLSRLSDEEVIEALTQVKGIGVWTVQMFLIFVLHRPDVLPVDDLGLRKAVQLHYAFEELPDVEQVTAVGDAWRPYRSVATWYLWQSLNNKPM